ncbi:MAG: AAA family ATPase [Gemmatimonadetes bacterium]|nr:MAG: AAA family ATPase [Gemmatimonadota bacterium]
MSAGNQLQLFLNPNFTFDHFIVGNSNRFAYAAAKGVADMPGFMHNPLFIYSGVGLGKTHLISAIGNELLQTNPEIQIIYTTAEQFANELLDALERRKSIDDFHNKYRNVDCLLIDDIQFLADKDRSQTELLHTFDTLYTLQKQIVFTSDRPPKSMDLDERLRSRFEGGLVADIQLPDFETRVAILNNKAALRNITLPEELIYEIAQGITSNIRELEGFLNQVLAISSLNDAQVTVEWVQRLLAERQKRYDTTPPPSPAVEVTPPPVAQPEPQSLAKSPAKSSLPEEFGQFIEEVEHDVSQTISKRQEEEELREFYRQKLYVWEMKGFNVVRLQQVIDGNVEEIERVFREYTRDAKRLAEFQKQLACLDVRGLEADARKIEQNLFNPEAIDQIAADLKRLETRIERRQTYRQTLILDFRFENYIAGDENKMLMSIAKAVSQAPAKQYNPLYIHGGVGLGKTHLLHAIGNYIVDHHAHLNVLYITVDEFARHLIKAIEERRTDDFRMNYNEIDVLLMDDIQRLSGKERTQEEFFHCFNTLYSVNKQIVISGDRPPNLLTEVEHRIRSRFEGGLVIELKSPKAEVRRTIVKNYIEALNLTIDPRALDYITHQYQHSIRELRGILNRLTAQCSVNGETTITLDTLRSVLGENSTPSVSAPSTAKRPASTTTPQPSNELVRDLLSRMIVDWNKPPTRLDMEL